MHKPQLYKDRNFSDVINETFQLLRTHFKPFAQFHAKYTLPVGLLVVLLLQLLRFGSGIGMAFDAQQMTESAGATGMFIFMGGSALFNSLFYLVIALGTTVYMQRHYFGEPAASTDVYQYLAPAVVAMLITIIATAIGLVLLMLPGIYIMIALALFVPALVFYKAGAVDSLEHSFRLVKTDWFGTFALIIVISLIASVIGFVFGLPAMVIAFMSAFHTIHEGSDTTFLTENMVLQILLSLGVTIFTALGNVVIYSIMQIAINLQYGSLVERTEARGLMADIEEAMSDKHAHV
jgi:hypothetical protein